jgi:hypothetical protein
MVRTPAPLGMDRRFPRPDEFAEERHRARHGACSSAPLRHEQLRSICNCVSCS